MKERIVKIFTGFHIDLEAIVAISEVRFDGRWVGFDIISNAAQVHGGNPTNILHYGRHMEFDEQQQDRPYRPLLEDGTVADNLWGSGEKKPLALVNLQKQVDEVVKIWKDYHAK